MKKHTSVYCDYFGIVQDDPRLCEWCEQRVMVDVNHIIPRGMGGKNAAVDVVENLVGMCRECHLQFEAKRIGKEELRLKHSKNLSTHL